MTGDDATPTSIPLNQWPDPVCQFTVEDRGPVIRSVNDPFAETFGEIATGQSVSTVFSDAGLSLQSAGNFESMIADEGPHRVQTNRTDVAGGMDCYLVRTVSPNPADGGVIVFTPIPDKSNPGTDAGIEIDHVASIVSHDLRNPLDVAKARLRAGRESGADEHFERVADAHERMERIVRDVLTLAGGADAIDPASTVRVGNAAELAWETVETGNSTLIVEDSLPTTTADPDRLRRLFENLFRNSVEHGSTNGPSKTDGNAERPGSDVTVTLGTLDGNGSDFYVADDGPGIPPDRLDRVFEPGYSTDDHGTGLGMAIVARIVKLHGWSITATESAAGGARFEITGVE